MWLMKVKESQQFKFFASYAIDIHANEFQLTLDSALRLELTKRAYSQRKKLHTVF